MMLVKELRELAEHCQRTERLYTAVTVRKAVTEIERLEAIVRELGDEITSLKTELADARRRWLND